MNKVISYAGGLLGSYALLNQSFAGTYLASLEQIFDVVAATTFVVFSGALLWEGIKTLIKK